MGPLPACARNRTRRRSGASFPQSSCRSPRPRVGLGLPNRCQHVRPNRVGKGWLQPVADGVKNFVKEETYPDAANLPLFILAPVLSFIPALTTWAVIPFAAPWGSRTSETLSRTETISPDLSK